MISIVTYILATLLANFTATWFIPLYIFGAQISLGTIIFGVTFTARDRVHSQFGRTGVYKMIGATVVLAILQSIFFRVPVSIIIASTVATICAETTDTEVFQRLQNKNWLTRVLASNAVSIPIDSILFASIAFYPIMPIPVIVSIVLGEIIVKYLVALIVGLWKQPKLVPITP